MEFNAWPFQLSISLLEFSMELLKLWGFTGYFFYLFITYCCLMLSSTGQAHTWDLTINLKTCICFICCAFIIQLTGSFEMYLKWDTSHKYKEYHCTFFWQTLKIQMNLIDYHHILIYTDLYSFFPLFSDFWEDRHTQTAPLP